MKPIDIVDIKTQIKKGWIIPYIKNIYGTDFVCLTNEAGEVITLGTVEELKKVCEEWNH